MSRIDDLYCAKFDFAPHHGPRRDVVVATTPRSGSTFLCLQMWRTGALGAPMEYFNLANRRRDMVPRLGQDIASYAERLFKLRTSPNDIFATKLFLPDVAQLIQCEPQMLSHLRMDRVIFLCRRDKLAQAISHLRASQTGAWHADQTVRGRACYREQDIERNLAWIAMQETQWEHWFARLPNPPLRLFYEDVCGDPAGAIDAVLAHVGVERGDKMLAEISDPMRQRNVTSVRWARRFERSRGLREWRSQVA